MNDDYQPPKDVSLSSAIGESFLRGTNAPIEPALKSCSYCGALGRPDRRCEGCGASVRDQKPKRRWYA